MFKNIFSLVFLGNLILFYSQNIYCDDNSKWKNIQDEYKRVFKVVNNISISASEKYITVRNFIEKYGIETPYSLNLFPHYIKRCIRNNKIAYCYYDNKIFISSEYDYASSFIKGYAAVRIGKKWGIIDVNGKVIVDINYSADDIKYRIKKLREKNNVIDVSFDDENQYIIQIFPNGVIVFDRKGNLIIPLKYQSILWFVNNITWVNFNGKWGVIDKKDRKIIDFKYDEVDNFYEGLSRFRINKKWGFVDMKGNELIKAEYDYANNFSDGLAMVELNNKIGFIDRNGNIKIPLKYEWGESFSNGIAKIKLNGKEGYVDNEGNEMF